MSYYAYLKEKMPVDRAVFDVSLRDLTSFRLGGACTCVVTPQNGEELHEVLRDLQREAIPYHVLGNGTNVLAPDEGFDGVILKLPAGDVCITETGCLQVSAGTMLSMAANRALQAGFMGMEGLAGIPGTIGGAVAMNAGAYGYEIKDILEEVTILRNGCVKAINVDKTQLGYRHSPFSAPGCIVLDARLQLTRDDGNARARQQEFQQRRREKQPLEYPSAGSTFKRPVGYFAGALIEQCGLKGYRVGDAMVSEKHAGFVVNAGKATCSDVLAVISHVQETVLKQFGVMLEREVKLLSEV